MTTYAQMELPFEEAGRDNDVPFYLTAFLVLVAKDGTVTATGDLDQQFRYEQQASHAHVRMASRELLDSIESYSESIPTVVDRLRIAAKARGLV